MQQSILTFKTSGRVTWGKPTMPINYGRIGWGAAFSTIKKILKDVFVEGVQPSICGTPCECWSERQQAQLKYLAQKTESFTDLHANKARRQKTETINKEDRPKTFKNNQNEEWRGRRGMNVERSPPPSSPCGRATLSPPTLCWSKATALSTCDLI